MKITIFGLSLSSSWGNGHATLWRGLCHALAERGHEITFFELDRPYYAAHRDLHEWSDGKLVVYSSWEEVEQLAMEEISDADVSIVTSYCASAQEATQLMLERARYKVFYDLDTPVTLSRLRDGDPVPYLPREGLMSFDLVLSYTGGEALRRLQVDLGARRVAPLYGSVDPRIHHRVPTAPNYQCELSYLGTYSADRQVALERLFIEPGRKRRQAKFIMGGAQYPTEFPWAENIHFVQHLPPSEHAAFFSSSRMTLNVTRGPMAELGYCPSGRLFEAAACGVPILTDTWAGLEDFFTPETEILTGKDVSDVLAALDRSPEDLQRMAKNALERVNNQHTAMHRAIELEHLFERSRNVKSVY
jgi:spore maturation protein CgeB